jgi:hypothetical protein
MPTTPTAQTPPGRAFRGRGGVVASKMYDGGEEEKSAGQEERGVEVLSGEEAIQRLLRTAEPPVSGKSRSEVWRCVHMFEYIYDIYLYICIYMYTSIYNIYTYIYQRY